MEIGLKSFEAVTIFAPSIILGLYWKKGNRNGAMAGIMAGFIIWFYTLLMPALLKAEVFSKGQFVDFLLYSDIFNPHALLGLKGLDKWSHSLFWGLFFNLLLYVGLSLFTRQKREEERQALLFVESYSPKMVPKKISYTIQQIEDILGQYIGKMEAREIIDRFMRRQGINRESITQGHLIRLRDEAERILSGALGSAIATIIFEDKLTLTEQERGELSSSIQTNYRHPASVPAGTGRSQ